MTDEQLDARNESMLKQLYPPFAEKEIKDNDKVSDIR
jgi:hypothetical protein